MIKVEHLHYSYVIGKKGKQSSVPVLKDVCFEINKGEIVSIIGRSGSGKSTVLNLLSGYIKADSGKLTINSTDVTDLNEKQWAKFRLDHFGFIFQNYELIPGLTAFENVELPLTLKGIDRKTREGKAHEMIQKVGLSEHKGHYPNELSGGQQQRVSIARALITEPMMILADEPTGSLDSETEAEVLSLIKQLNKDQQITFLIITHDQEVANIGNRTLKIHDGMMKQEGGVYFEAN
ncbi:ABC transporter ATP-binding protein [Alteribacter keqinensis]|uniref:ABC transporter ATP-binding protein n=1 Tax=Alteribacter keqinensis TaxID=2483800 RepID=A0A3M7TUS0_9BACI|nr:ABC transporter ATP-binding protein [Alteribacter keqinensis]RNA69390.1 ABC transporter ATP-binding protein [Alteribacter keqinensis]